VSAVAKLIRKLDLPTDRPATVVQRSDDVRHESLRVLSIKNRPRLRLPTRGRFSVAMMAWLAAPCPASSRRACTASHLHSPRASAHRKEIALPVTDGSRRELDKATGPEDKLGAIPVVRQGVAKHGIRHFRDVDGDASGHPVSAGEILSSRRGVAVQRTLAAGGNRVRTVLNTHDLAFPTSQCATTQNDAPPSIDLTRDFGYTC